MQLAGFVLYELLFAFILLLFARFIMDWVQVFAREWTPRGPGLVVLEVLYSTTDPPIRAVRRLLPPLRLGGMMLDLSPLIVLVICFLLRAVVRVSFGL